MCSEPDCENPPRSRGLCTKHYTRLLRHGSPSKVLRAREAADISEVLNLLLDRSGECWLWTGGCKRQKDGSTRGMFSHKGKDYLAHRAAFEAYVGEIPPGGQVRQACENVLCCRPDHLELSHPAICNGCGIPSDKPNCSACRAEYATGWRQRNPEKAREASQRYRFRKKYGITLDDYYTMLESQGGVCAICARADPGLASRTFLCVDHDHGTGAVRGLLCANCNTGIGMFRDDPEFLTAAIRYLNVANVL